MYCKYLKAASYGGAVDLGLSSKLRLWSTGLDLLRMSTLHSEHWLDSFVGGPLVTDRFLGLCKLSVIEDVRNSHCSYDCKRLCR